MSQFRQVPVDWPVNLTSGPTVLHRICYTGPAWAEAVQERSGSGKTMDGCLRGRRAPTVAKTPHYCGRNATLSGWRRAQHVRPRF